MVRRGGREGERKGGCPCACAPALMCIICDREVTRAPQCSNQSSLNRDHLKSTDTYSRLLVANQRREVSWTLTKKLDTFGGPGEIKRREVSWTLTKKLDTFVGPGETRRMEVVLVPQASPEEITNREVELGSESWTSLLSVVTQQQCYGHCPCDSAPHRS